MASFEIIGSHFAAQVFYELTQDVALNQSVVKITGVSMRSVMESWSAVSCRVSGGVTINGSTAVKMGYSTGISMGKEYSAIGGEVSKYSVAVEHQQDGSGPISVYVNLSVYGNPNSIEMGGLTKTETVELPRIPRVSTMTAAGVELGQEMTIQLTRAAEGFVDTVTWSCGGESGTIAEQTALTKLQWTPPMGLASQAPEDTQVAVVLTVTSFLEGTQVGSKDTAVPCTIPESVVPTLAVTVEDRMGYLSKFGGYVQNQSQARVMTQAAGAYASTIRSITAKCGALSAAGADVSFVLGQSGNVPVTVTVTDSRGRSASYETAITVLPYRMPQVTIREAFRCDETGSPQPDGTWLKVVFDGSVTALAGNSAAYRGICTVHNGDTTRTVLLEDYTGQQTVTGGSFLLTAGIDTAYDCRVSVQDDFHTVTSVDMLVSVAFALMDFSRDTKAVGIGMRAKNAGKLSIGLDTDMDEHSIGNLADPTEATHAATKKYVDASIHKAAQRNLLDNSDFRNPVNQRGKTSYSNETQYTIDRWRIDPGVLTVNDNSISVTEDSSSGYAFFLQYVPDCVMGKAYTFAVKKTTGEIVIVNFVFSSDMGIVRTLFENTSQSANVRYSPTKKVLQVAITVNDDTAAELEWAALYEGEYTADTLPEYHSKGYGAELAECQRYCLAIDYGSKNSFAGYVSVSTTTIANAYFPLPAPMRTTPSLSSTDGSVWGIDIDGTRVVPTAAAIWFMSANAILGMKFTCSSGLSTRKTGVASYNSATKLILSCDL